LTIDQHTPHTPNTNEQTLQHIFLLPAKLTTRITRSFLLVHFLVYILKHTPAAADISSTTGVSSTTTAAHPTVSATPTTAAASCASVPTEESKG